jgi:aspartate-semialdehyde dehydrogenase
MRRIPVCIMGATGVVGQHFVSLLAHHPWFEVVELAASDRSAGLRYEEACHWLLPTPMPDPMRDWIVRPISVEAAPSLNCNLVFSALPSSVAGPVEEKLAGAGYSVCSNAAAHRMDQDTPLLIPEVNADHLALIHVQRRRRRWKGLIVTSPNCSTTQLALLLKPLQQAFGLRRLSVVTLQAISGAGYPGVPAGDILGNVVPFIAGEEEKIEQECRKLLGTLGDSSVSDAPVVVSAQCNRVPVLSGHMECVSIEFEHRPEVARVLAVLETFRGPAEVADLPSSPQQPVILREEPDRPQPALDSTVGRGMSVVAGRVRPCPVLHIRLVLLGANTIRGAAGGAIHNAELLVSQGWVGR